jgi:outer membrane receptor protein involved in Fe transport
MRIVHLVLACFLLFSGKAVAQEGAAVSGHVLDKTDLSVLPYATVTLLRGDSTLLTGVITDADGRFTLIGVPNGNYILEVSYVGYAPISFPLLIGTLNKNFDFGKIYLQATSAQLADVTVTGSREIVSQELERKTFDLGENFSQQGGSVLDAMRNLPGVTVTPEGKVQVRGSDQVSVLIDGKMSSLTGFGNQKGLDNLPASNIEKIEIINNPSAKYNAAGMAGIINIIYKKEKKTGFSGEWGIAGGVGELWTRQENLPRISPKYAWTPKLNPTISMNFRSEKVNWFFQGDGIIRRRVNANEFSTRVYTDGTPNIKSQFLENRTQKLYNLKGGLDWFMSDRTTLTVFALWQDEYHLDAGDVPYDQLETGQRLRLWTWKEDERTRFINYAVNMQHKFAQPGHELKAGYQYTGGGEDEYFPFTDSSAVRIGNDATFLTVFEYVHAFTADYVKPLRSGRFEGGVRVALRNIPITYTLTPGQNSILDPNLGEWSRYTENVFASYVNFIRERPKTDIEAGLRFEPSFVRYELDPANIYYEDNAYEYFPLFPSIRLTQKLNPGNTIAVFYNRRVDRPGEFEVRPFPKYDDPEILKTGNPNLRPQFTSTWEAAYKRYWDQGSLVTSLFYRQIENIFSRVYTQDSTSTYTVVNTIPANLGRGTNLGGEVTWQQAIGKSLKLTGSATIYQNHIDAFSGTSYRPYPQPFSAPANTLTTGNVKLVFNGKFREGFEWQVSGAYYAPDLIPQGKVLERFALDLGLKKTSKDGKTEWRFSATDLVNTFQIRKQFTGENFTLEANNYFESQVITLAVKRKF